MPTDLPVVDFLVAVLAMAPIAYLSTNIDNLSILLALRGSGAPQRLLAMGFIAAVIALLLVASAGAYADEFIPLGMLRYFGLVPVALGLRLLLSAPGDGPAARPQQGWLAIALLFLANSVDSMFVVGALVAESEAAAHAGLLFGYLLTAATTILVSGWLLSHARFADRMARAGSRFAPFLMIAIGLYIFWDSPTDLV